MEEPGCGGAHPRSQQLKTQPEPELQRAKMLVGEVDQVERQKIPLAKGQQPERVRLRGGANRNISSGIVRTVNRSGHVQTADVEVGPDDIRQC